MNQMNLILLLFVEQVLLSARPQFLVVFRDHAFVFSLLVLVLMQLQPLLPSFFQLAWPIKQKLSKERRRFVTFVSPGGRPRRFWPFVAVSFCVGGVCVVVKGGGLVRFGSNLSLLIVFGIGIALAGAGSVFIT